MNWMAITTLTWLVLAVAIVVPAAQARQDPIGDLIEKGLRQFQTASAGNADSTYEQA